MPKEEHTIVGSKPKRKKGTSFPRMSSKQHFKKKQMAKPMKRSL
jgi:hypothetical protein